MHPFPQMRKLMMKESSQDIFVIPVSYKTTTGKKNLIIQYHFTILYNVSQIG